MPDKIPFTADLIDSHCLIDVRTPLEFEEDHLPGAFNVPLLTNEERVEVGTIHKQVGPVQARRRALELTCGRYSAMVEQILAFAADRPVLVYCWRGGLRSNSVVMLLKLCGARAQQLIGGYKAYRHQVSAYFDECSFASRLIVIHGMTGIGKTTFITGLNREMWGVVDLEGVACHRGSAFGALGLAQSVSQKYFDTLLWEAFRHLPANLPIVLEGESRRIGKYYLPGRLYEVMAEACKIWCSASIETRIARLVEEYGHPEYRLDMLDSLDRIKKRLPGPRYDELKQSIIAWDVEKIARGLVIDYYDRMYYKQRLWKADLDLDFEDYSQAEAEMAGFYRRRISLM